MTDTVGQAYFHNWRIVIQCAATLTGCDESRRCRYSSELHLRTLLSAKGPGFPIARLAERLFCPLCSGLKMRVLCLRPGAAQVKATGGRDDLSELDRWIERPRFEALYQVDELDKDGSQMRVLAGCATFRIGRAAYDAAVAEMPKSNLLFRNRAHIVDSTSPRDAPGRGRDSGSA